MVSHQGFLAAIVMVASALGPGCATNQTTTVSSNEAATSSTLEDFIASNLHRPGNVLITRYDDLDPKPLAMPWEKLKTYCETQGGSLEPLPGKPVLNLNVRGANNWFGEFLCRQIDTKLWAVEIKPVSQPEFQGKMQSLLTFKVYSAYSVKLKAAPLPVAPIRLTACRSDTANAIHQQAQDFLDNKLKVVPRLVDRSGFNKSEPLDKLVEISRTRWAECPTAMDQVLFAVSVKPKLQHRLNFKVEPKEYPNVDYNSAGARLEPVVTIESYNFDVLYPAKSFRDKHVQMDIEYISGSAVQYRLRNLSSRYVDVQAVSIYIDQTVYTVPVSLSVPPNTTTVEQRMELSGLGKLFPITLTLNQAKSRTASIGVSVKYRIGDKTESLYGQQIFPYAQLVRY